MLQGLGLGAGGSKIKFSEHGHVAYQIKGDEQSGILQSPPSVRASVTLSPPKPLDEIQLNLLCELLT